MGEATFANLYREAKPLLKKINHNIFGINLTTVLNRLPFTKVKKYPKQTVEYYYRKPRSWWQRFKDRNKMFYIDSQVFGCNEGEFWGSDASSKLPTPITLHFGVTNSLLKSVKCYGCRAKIEKYHSVDETELSYCIEFYFYVSIQLDTEQRYDTEDVKKVIREISDKIGSFVKSNKNDYKNFSYAWTQWGSDWWGTDYIDGVEDSGYKSGGIYQFDDDGKSNFRFAVKVLLSKK